MYTVSSIGGFTTPYAVYLDLVTPTVNNYTVLLPPPGWTSKLRRAYNQGAMLWIDVLDSLLLHVIPEQWTTDKLNALGQGGGCAS